MSKKLPTTLFLDRDGVINQRIVGDYVRNVSEFVFLEGALQALVDLARKFDYLVVVTNQQGIAKGRMTEADLQVIHDYMVAQIERAGGRLDGVYYCPYHERDAPICRKPNPGMAHQAQADFPAITFERALMVGDSVSDLVFGQQLGMQTVLLTTKPDLDEVAYTLVKEEVWASLPSLQALNEVLGTELGAVLFQT